MTKRHWKEGKRVKTDFNTIAARMRSQISTKNETLKKRDAVVKKDRYDEFRERIALLRKRLEELSLLRRTTGS